MLNVGEGGQNLRQEAVWMEIRWDFGRISDGMGAPGRNEGGGAGPPPSPLRRSRRYGVAVIDSPSNWLIADCVTSCDVEKIPASCVAAAEARVTGEPIGA